jgi:hypothetical protein
MVGFYKAPISAQSPPWLLPLSRESLMAALSVLPSISDMANSSIVLLNVYFFFLLHHTVVL